MNTAIFISKIGTTRNHYKLSPPKDDIEYVIVSTVQPRFTNRPETYIFPSNKEGEVVSWLEMDGSRIGECSNADVLGDMGYAIVQQALDKQEIANDYVCPSCGNSRVSKCEKSCWLCGGKL